MPAPDATPVVIACPNCATRYQVAYSAIGRRGRNVQCANCGKSWQAHAERPAPLPRPPKPLSMPAPETEAITVDLPVPPRAIPMEMPLNKLAEEILDLQFSEEEAKQRARREAARGAPPKPDIIADLPPAAPRYPGASDDVMHDAFLKSRTKRDPAPAEAPGATAGLETGRDARYQRTVDEIKAAIAPRSPPAATGRGDSGAAHRRLQQAFSARQRSIANSLPLARFRRSARIGALLAIIALVASGYLGRYPLVQTYPQLAGLYAAIGLNINVVGLEFRKVRTLQSLQQGMEVLAVDGTIASVSDRPVNVPQVVVSLLDRNGASIYEWSMVPKVSMLAPGESVALDTQLSRPPVGATQVRLVFANGRQVELSGDDGMPANLPVPVVLGAAGGSGPTTHRPH